MKTCVFAGTFDPLTNGHVYVIEKCLESFGKVVIAVGENHDKTPTFTLSERIDMIKQTFLDNPNVEVKEFNGMLVEFMKKENIKINVRGIRNEKDYLYETQMSRYNLDMYPELTTIFIPTPAELEHISSTGVRSIMSYKAQADKFVPPVVAKAIENKFSKK
jgi:pantetheine-phosphate adenylyltransferase